MKKILKILLVVILLAVILPIAKNLYLFAYYHHGEDALYKVSGKEGVLTGKWHGIFDTIQCGMDERHDITYIFKNETSGVELYDFYGERISGRVVQPYSWEALLPLNKKSMKSTKSQIIADSEYFKCIPISENGGFVDTTFVKYKIENNKLYLDTVLRNSPYSDEPEWGVEFSPKVELKPMFFFWEEWKRLF